MLLARCMAPLPGYHNSNNQSWFRCSTRYSTGVLADWLRHRTRVPYPAYYYASGYTACRTPYRGARRCGRRRTAVSDGHAALARSCSWASRKSHKHRACTLATLSAAADGRSSLIYILKEQGGRERNCAPVWFPLDHGWVDLDAAARGDFCEREHEHDYDHRRGCGNGGNG